MKTTVLTKAMRALHFRSENVYSIITLISLCDFLNNKNLIAERLTRSFKEDIDYCVENFEFFSIVNNVELRFKDLFTEEYDNFYKELKSQSFQLKDTQEPDLSVLDIMENKNFSGHFYFLNSEKVISSVIAKWLVNDTRNNTVYCPFNNLINVENELTCDNMITSPYFVIAEARARAMYHACNELKVPKQVLTAPDTIGTLTQNYDLGFSFPPCSWNIGSIKSGEINLLKDMLENISGRFCLIFSLAFAFQSGALEKLREKIINEKRLKAIVELPGGYVPNSNISCMAMFFDKTDENQDSVTFISLADDTCKDKEHSNRYKTVLNDYAISMLENGLKGIESELCRKVSFEEILKNKYCLTPSRYVLSEEGRKAQQQILKGNVKLGDIAEFYRAQMTKPENEGNTFFEVSASDINSVGFVENPGKQILLSKDVSELKNALKKGDIVFAIKGSVSKVGLVTEEHDNWLINQSFVIIRIKNPEWPVEFVFRQLKSSAMRLYVQSKTIGSIIPSLTIAELKDLPLIAPTGELIEEQKRKHERQMEIAATIAELQKELGELNNF